MDANDLHDASPDASLDPLLVIAATMYLMRCHSTRPCPRLAGMIKRHLCELASLDIPPLLTTTCRQFCGKWDALSALVERASIFASLAAGFVHTR